MRAASAAPRLSPVGWLVVFLLCSAALFLFWPSPPAVPSATTTRRLTGEANVLSQAYCDKLCAQYDATHDTRVCEQLRVECQLPCDVDRVYLDIVFLWANGSEPEYGLVSNRIRRSLVNHSEWQRCFRQATESRRARELGTFRYAMRALFAHVPFVRRVYVITPLGQWPSWLRRSHAQVRAVDVCTLVPGVETTFNSNAIQLQMHHIPTLSDPFITLNDDFLILKPQRVEDFVALDGRLVYYTDYYSTDQMWGCWGDLVSKAASMYKSHFKHDDRLFVAAHRPLPVAHNVASFIERRWHDDVERVKSHVFRNWQDPTFDSFHIWVASAMGTGTTQMISWECKGSFGLADDSKMDDVFTALQSPPVCRALALNDDFSDSSDAAIINNVNVLLEAMFPVASPVERNDTGIVAPPTVVQYRCAHSNAPLEVPIAAFAVPKDLFSYHHSVFWRSAADYNEKNDTAEVLYRNFRPLDALDVANDFAPAPPAPLNNSLRVAQWHAGRGRNWCETVVAARGDDVLAEASFWFVSSLDLGMARSRNAHTARRLAGGLRLNYAWAPQFYELQRGTQEERDFTEGQFDTWGLHGNAILSKWPLRRVELVKFPDGLQLFNRPKLAGERRLGFRHAIVAEASVEFAQPARTVAVTLIALDTMIASGHALDSAHGRNVTALLAARIRSYGNAHVVMGGAFWLPLCEALGLTPLLFAPVPLVDVDWQRDRTLLIDTRSAEYQVCARGFDVIGKPTVWPASGFINGWTAMRSAFSESPFVAAELVPLP